MWQGTPNKEKAAVCAVEFKRPFLLPIRPEYVLPLPEYRVLVVTGWLGLRPETAGKSASWLKGVAIRLPRMYVVSDSSGEVKKRWSFGRDCSFVKPIRLGKFARVITVALGDGRSFRCWNVDKLVEVTDFDMDWPKERLPWTDIAVSKEGETISAVAVVYRWLDAPWKVEYDLFIRPRYWFTTEVSPGMWFSSDEQYVIIQISTNWYSVYDVRQPELAGADWDTTLKYNSVVSWLPGEHRFVTFAGKEHAECWDDEDRTTDYWLCMYQVTRTTDRLSLQRVWQVPVVFDQKTDMVPALLWCGESQIVGAFVGRQHAEVGKTLTWTQNGRLLSCEPLYGARVFGTSVRKNSVWIASDKGCLLKLIDATREDHPMLQQGPVVDLVWQGESRLWGMLETSTNHLAICEYDVTQQVVWTRARIERDAHYSHVWWSRDDSGLILWLLGSTYNSENTRTALRVTRARLRSGKLEIEFRTEKTIAGHCRLIRCFSGEREPGLNILLYSLNLPSRGKQPEDAFRVARLQWLELSNGGRFKSIVEYDLTSSLRTIQLTDGVFVADGRGFVAAILGQREENRRNGKSGLLIFRRDGSCSTFEETFQAHGLKNALPVYADSLTAVFILNGSKLAAVKLDTGGLCWAHHIGNGIASVAAAADRGFLVLGLPDGQLQLRDLENGNVVSTHEAHDGLITTVEMNNAGRVATGGADGRVCVWEFPHLRL